MLVATEKEEMVRALCEKWPSAKVARAAAPRFLGFAYTAKSLANLDSVGRGPSGTVRIGRRVIYDAQELARWFVEQVQPIERRQGGRAI